MYARSVTSDLGCQSPEEGQRIDRKFEVCPNFCVEIMGLDSIFTKLKISYSSDRTILFKFKIQNVQI